MIGTDEPGPVAARLGADHRSTMAADVEQRMHLTVVAADHDERLAGDRIEEIVSGIGDPGDVARIEPGLHDHLLDVALEHVGARVELAVETPSRALRRDQVLRRPAHRAPPPSAAAAAPTSAASPPRSARRTGRSRFAPDQMWRRTAASKLRQ